ncbi:MAG: MotE family protein [Thermodesulfobacteriota bacterium]
MASRSKATRAEGPGRAGGDPARENFRVNRKGPVVLLASTAFALLFVLKILLTGMLLTGLPFDLGQRAALAEDKAREGTSSLEREQALLNKEQRLRDWEKELKKKEQQLLPLQGEIDQKMAELEEIQDNLTAFAKRLAEREEALNDARIKHLVSVYQEMEPNRAAAIMGKLDIPTVVRILGNMRGKAAGQILASMPPERGAEISGRLSRMD